MAWSTVVQTAVRCVKQCSLKSAVDRQVSLLSVAVMSSPPARSTRSLSATYLVLRRRRQYDSVADTSASPITRVKSLPVLYVAWLISVIYQVFVMIFGDCSELPLFMTYFVLFEFWYKIENSDLFGLLVVIVMLTISYCGNVKSNQ